MFLNSYLFHSIELIFFCNETKELEVKIWIGWISLVDETIGIIGAGYLGRTLAETLIEHGYPKKRLMISYKGSLSTFENIKKAGLIENITDNKKICQKSTVIFIAVKPQSLKEVKDIPFTRNSIVVSCMAGISLATLKKSLGINISRIMPSGPDTIKEKKGIVAVFPQNDILTEILSFIDLKVHELQNEEMMHIFTVGVCLPAALLIANKKRLDIDHAIKCLEKEYIDFKEIYTWAINVLPDFASDKEEENYIEYMCTKGGITEAIIGSLNSGDTFWNALRKGIARSKEISTFARLT